MNALNFLAQLCIEHWDEIKTAFGKDEAFCDRLGGILRKFEEHNLKKLKTPNSSNYSINVTPTVTKD